MSVYFAMQSSQLHERIRRTLLLDAINQSSLLIAMMTAQAQENLQRNHERIYIYGRNDHAESYKKSCLRQIILLAYVQ
jgi:hypothetical protein